MGEIEVSFPAPQTHSLLFPQLAMVVGGGRRPLLKDCLGGEINTETHLLHAPELEEYNNRDCWVPVSG